MGTLVGLAVPLFAKPEDPRACGVGGLAGMGAGLAAAWWMTQDWDAGGDDAPRAREARAVPFAARTASGRLTVGLAGRF